MRGLVHVVVRIIASVIATRGLLLYILHSIVFDVIQLRAKQSNKTDNIEIYIYIYLLRTASDHICRRAVRRSDSYTCPCQMKSTCLLGKLTQEVVCVCVMQHVFRQRKCREVLATWDESHMLLMRREILPELLLSYRWPIGLFAAVAAAAARLLDDLRRPHTFFLRYSHILSDLLALRPSKEDDQDIGKVDV